ncbi:MULTISPECIES: nitroreductase family deazaflavin-dependent oxidoreductase [unclassified Streptomyces]|uniref:Nitroreductase family deazaflavin-dependent oxidoreductase n=1 Tax=Streptomyces sp. NBC_00119 TaxID=2975659 RepID=A0AAU1U2W5_9ACTN|nr:MULTISPECIES: nitroreductase family deazaflavin-dependent oxidoreductase [unclassified Streptomyces]MCX4641161.1 nitroreductase family deazaflavin-dependent oxidoreductase [Streptomyces sp. NBC_01446]MCX5322423.1 nitroreductase family deazaflavin-dependent oxidoreductase [Streptomyces sp. NBC_00120]
MAQDETGTDVVISPTGWVAEQARLYEESGGTEGTTIPGPMSAPCLLLDYQGRRSGQWRRTVLIYDRDGDDYLIVASKGGADQHPEWYLNLEANPDVRLRVGTERFTARAETLSPEEKARVWPHLVEIFAPYADYQKKTDRDIPVVRLTRTKG